MSECTMIEECITCPHLFGDTHDRACCGALKCPHKPTAAPPVHEQARRAAKTEAFVAQNKAGVGEGVGPPVEMTI